MAGFQAEKNFQTTLAQKMPWLSRDHITCTSKAGANVRMQEASLMRYLSYILGNN